MSVTYDSVNILTGNYKITTLGHDSSSENIINSLKPSRQDGLVVISDNYNAKYIDIVGMIKGTSQANLETNIDSFKELISREDKNLDISYAGGTRRYVCRSIFCNISREYYQIIFANYRVRFIVPDGYGKNTSVTTAFNPLNITANDTQAYTFLGSYPSKPKHKITLDTRGNLDVVRIENNTTSDYMDIDWGNVSGDPTYVEIDEEALTVLDNSGNPVTYRGKFPSANLGASTTMKLYVYGSGSTLDQQQTSNTGGSRGVYYDNGSYLPWQAQSFVASQSGRIHKLNLYVDMVDGGSLSGPMQFLFYADDNDKPASTPLSGTGYEISHANVPTSVAWTDAVWQGTDAQRPFLTANTKYWLVLNPGVIVNSDINNFYGWYYNNVATGYTSGKTMYRNGSGDDWKDGMGNAQTGGTAGQFDICFKEYRGVDGGAASWQVDWLCNYTKKYL